MNLTEKECLILQLAQQGLSDYRIARKLDSDPPSITRSHKNAHKKLLNSIKDLEWALRMNVAISEEYGMVDCAKYNFFL